jgi:uncharacterized protein YhaN
MHGDNVEENAKRQEAAAAQTAALKARREQHDARVERVQDVRVGVAHVYTAGGSRTRPELIHHWLQHIDKVSFKSLNLFV